MYCMIWSTSCLVDFQTPFLSTSLVSMLNHISTWFSHEAWRVDDADAVIWVFEERFAGRHGLEDALLTLDPEVFVDAATLCHQPDERLRLVGVQVLTTWPPWPAT